jgi:hypothetical protein
MQAEHFQYKIPPLNYIPGHLNPVHLPAFLRFVAKYSLVSPHLHDTLPVYTGVILYPFVAPITPLAQATATFLI